MDIFHVALSGLIALLVIGMLWLTSSTLIGGFIYPFTKSMNPNNAEGISSAQFDSTADKLNAGATIFFIIMIAVPFLYIIFKILYEREETSVYGDG